MRGHSGWNYAPYQPLVWNGGDIYVCRLAPGKDFITMEWLPVDGEGEYAVCLRERGSDAAFENVGTTVETQYTVSGLKDATDYEFYVEKAGKRSRVRLARTGEAVGTVVNYLHPEDEVYSFSGRALCSPSLLRCPDGSLLASMDVFAGREPQNLSLLFRSVDEGKTWRYVTDLFPCFWGKLFEHKGKVYMLACSQEYGDLLIGCSEDNGNTFSTPVVLLRGGCHCDRPGVHKNPQNIVHYKGRIWETLEWGCWAGGVCHDAMVMSCDEDADLMVPENWSFTPPLDYDPNWPGVAKGESAGCIEGTLVVFPDGDLYNVMRYDCGRCEPSYGLVLAYKVNADDPDASIEYDHAIKFPANHSKFQIKKDDVTGKYLSICSRITSHELRGARTLVSLMKSDDCENWEVVCDLIDRRDCDPQAVGFQYMDFHIEGEDILWLCRTAMNGAANFHDANYSTFHRIEGFRELL